jgi:predicted nucleic acid-binding protein
VTVFADSSAIVGSYLCEPVTVSDIGERFVVSDIAQVEVTSAVWRRARAADVPAEHAATISAGFAADCLGTAGEEPRFVSVPVTDAVLAEARHVIATRGLRSLDAIQLATAIVVRQADPDCDTVAVLDRRLRDAVAAEGFRLLPANLSGP